MMEWWNQGKSYLTGLVGSFSHQSRNVDLIGLVFNDQYIKLLKIKRSSSHYEVEHFNLIDLPEGLIKDLELKDSIAVAAILKEIISDSGLHTTDVVLSISRSSAIVKTINVDSRLHVDEIESRVWLEADKLFPSLIGDIYLDFAINGPLSHDATQLEVLIVACRKNQLNPYLDMIKLAGLNVKVVDVNYYAYERALLLMTKHAPDVKTIAFFNLNFRLMDLLVVHENKLVYTHELAYDGHHLLKLRDVKTTEPTNDFLEMSQDILKNSIGLHLKHTLQFFYSSKPNIRIDRIILGGDVPGTVPGVVNYIKQETGKEVVLADPFVDMTFSNTVNQARLVQFAPGLVLCCGLALTKLSDGRNHAN